MSEARALQIFHYYHRAHDASPLLFSFKGWKKITISSFPSHQWCNKWPSHLSIQLIDDKKGLTERCEQLVKELKMIDRKYQDKIKSMEEKWVFHFPVFFACFRLSTTICSDLGMVFILTIMGCKTRRTKDSVPFPIPSRNSVQVKR